MKYKQYFKKKKSLEGLELKDAVDQSTLNPGDKVCIVILTKSKKSLMENLIFTPYRYWTPISIPIFAKMANNNRSFKDVQGDLNYTSELKQLSLAFLETQFNDKDEVLNKIIEEILFGNLRNKFALMIFHANKMNLKNMEYTSLNGEMIIPIKEILSTMKTRVFKPERHRSSYKKRLLDLHYNMNHYYGTDIYCHTERLKETKKALSITKKTFYNIIKEKKEDTEDFIKTYHNFICLLTMMDNADVSLMCSEIKTKTRCFTKRQEWNNLTSILEFDIETKMLKKEGLLLNKEDLEEDNENLISFIKNYDLMTRRSHEINIIIRDGSQKGRMFELAHHEEFLDDCRFYCIYSGKEIDIQEIDWNYISLNKIQIGLDITVLKTL